MMENDKDKALLPFVVGEADGERLVTWNLADVQNLLISCTSRNICGHFCGELISSLMTTRMPVDLRFAVFDCGSLDFDSEKYANVMEQYFVKFPHTGTGTVATHDDALKALLSLEEEMRQRYDLIIDAEVGNIRDYNEKYDRGELCELDDRHHHLPLLVVIIEQYADLHDEDFLLTMIRIARLGHEVGIYVVASTSRIDTEVVNGLIKANFRARITYKLRAVQDSELILDEQGAENLNRDELLAYYHGKTIRLQRPMLSYEEEQRIIRNVSKEINGKNIASYILPAPRATLLPVTRKRDPLFAEAAAFFIKEGSAKTSALQRHFSIGFRRTIEIMDQLEYCGIIGPAEQVGKSRDVLIKI